MKLLPPSTNHPTSSNWKRAWRTLSYRALPRRADYVELPRSWVRDLFAGITVAMVALPLALAFGVASGVGAAMGLITAVVAGIIAAVFGGSHVQISGPTGAMAVVLAPIVATHGAQSVALVSLMAGILVLVMGLTGLGRAISFIPWPVIEGFTIGIAVIIALQQVPLALNMEKAPGHNTAWAALQSILATNWSAAVYSLLIVAGVALIVILLPKIRSWLPASIIAVIAATIVAEVLDLPVARIAEIPSSLPLPQLPPGISLGTLESLFSAALAVAFLAAIESLLSARVADGMTDLPPANPNRELVGQGLASIGAGFFGGMPATGAIARTAVNVRSGARTRLSAIVHSLILLAVVYVGADLVARIPLAALAGVLFVTSLRIIDRAKIRAIMNSTRGDALVFVATAFATIIFDLILAVQLGVVVAVLLALRGMAKAARIDQEAVLPLLHLITDPAEVRLLQSHVQVYRIDGAIFFGMAQRFLDKFTQLAQAKVVILRLGTVKVIDATGANTLVEIISGLEKRGITVLLHGIKPEHRQVLRAIGVLDSVAHPNHIFDDIDLAILHAQRHVHRALDSGSPHQSASAATQ